MLFRHITCVALRITNSSHFSAVQRLYEHEIHEMLSENMRLPSSFSRAEACFLGFLGDSDAQRIVTSVQIVTANCIQKVCQDLSGAEDRHKL